MSTRPICLTPGRRALVGGGALYHSYAHELSDADHAALLQTLRSLKGHVVLSGYPAPVYDEALYDWRRVEKQTLADGARPRTEVLWLNPSCSSALDRDRGAGTLFANHCEADNG